MRVFIAIDIDEKTRAAIADVQQQLNAKVDIKKGDVKWVEPKNIHLTLKFLGDVEISRIDAISEALKNVAGGFSHFIISLAGIGAFPNSRKPKVIWVGLESGADELTQMAE